MITCDIWIIGGSMRCIMTMLMILIISTMLTIITMTISPVVDQIIALSRRAGQRVPGDKHVSPDIDPRCVEIYGYPQTRPATVDQNNLHWMIITMMTNSVVPPPGPASAT